ncbi:MAG: cytochrome class [Daejeonella sp.]|nr:cytochrome class [Daejeonella sp.]
MNTKGTRFTKLRGAIVAGIFLVCIVSAISWNNDKLKPIKDGFASLDWTAPSENSIPAGESGKSIRYGRELIAHTSYYLGPRGKVAHLSNGMNCQNCHLNAGTKAFGLNYSAVSSSYPKFQPRSGAVVSIKGRINGCFQRSLNGQTLDTTSTEMLAMVAYLNWLGKDVTKGIKPANSGVKKLSYLSRAANPDLGKMVFVNKCQQCHGPNGLGILNSKKTEYIYPPLWGNHSYNDGAGLYRLSNFAGFVKNNMPYGTDYKHPQITDEMAWDVAAFVNNQQRPHKDQKSDWKNLDTKPIDFPFGPYADHYSEQQHKFGPFTPIAAFYKD